MEVDSDILLMEFDAAEDMPAKAAACKAPRRVIESDDDDDGGGGHP